MTAPDARMTPERLDELTRRITSDLWCGGPVDRELLDALVAERAHAQQVEVPHTSATDLKGFCDHDGGRGIGAGHVCQCVRRAGHSTIEDRPHGCTCGAMW